MLLSQGWQYLARYASLQRALGYAATSRLPPFPTFAFTSHWQLLGPFQIGTRGRKTAGSCRTEVQWGADPLEQHYGGFRALEFEQHATFRSSLAINGTVSWSNCTAQLSDPSISQASVDLQVSFPDIEWQRLRDVYGWAALQWQAWARGAIIVQSDETVVLSLSMGNIVELWLDGEQYFGGDLYGYKRASIAVRLKTGSHRLDVRLVRDVRAIGGVGEPDMTARLTLQKSDGYLEPILQSVLMSDFVGNRSNAVLASPYASVVVRNDAQKDMYIHAVEPTHDACVAELVTLESTKLAPGQSRPIAFRIGCVVPIDSGPLYGHILLDVKGRVDGEEEIRLASFVAYPKLRSVLEPHKVTYMHPGGIVSYAVLRAPSTKVSAVLNENDTIPVFLGLHGAGLEAENDIVRHSMDPLPDLEAWVLFPTGVTPWSGDDWHVWGFADVEAAVAMIPDRIRRHEWRGPGVNTEKWLVQGHSNGGQGAWYALTHRPDKVIAAAPLSGYSSIQNYVPYTFWAQADPGRTAVVQSALLSYRHELLLPNAAGIPVLQQHGGEDDNVPPYHSRLLAQLVQQAGVDSQYIEFSDQPHWWDGVSTTEPLRKFYTNGLSAGGPRTSPALGFTLVVANPGDAGPKYGLEILQLLTPGQLGKIEALFDPYTGACTLKPSNVGVFMIPTSMWECSLVWVNGQSIPVAAGDGMNLTLAQTDGHWHVHIEELGEWPRPILRRGRQLGAMDAILTTHGAFQIVRHSPGTERIALQISRNLCQYFAADTEITDTWDDVFALDGNVISVAIGYDLPGSFREDFPIQWEKPNLMVRTPDRRTRAYTEVPGLGLAAIYLRPLPLGRLELVVWAADEASLGLAARLVPMITGTGQPDFVIADGTMLAKGLEGALALGFFNQVWDVSLNSFFS